MTSWYLCNECNAFYTAPDLKERSCIPCTAVFYCASLSRWQLLRLFWQLWRRHPPSLISARLLHQEQTTAAPTTPGMPAIVAPGESYDE
jgi:hypothetical protein